MGMIKNRAKVARDIQIAMDRVADAPVALYRGIVWEIFTRIVAETPQFSGRAVANWNLGINTPDMSFGANMGEDIDLSTSRFKKSTENFSSPHREKGDPKWAQEALERARYVLRRIKRGDKVFITNATRGDNDGGQSSEAYLADLQRPGYWASKLREANQPYETAMESAIMISENYLARGTMPIAGLKGNT